MAAVSEGATSMASSNSSCVSRMTLVGETWELEPDSARQVVIPDRAPLALVRLGDEYFVLDDTCTHGAASLSDGDIADGEIICPFHSGSFDIRTGMPKRFPCTEALRVYPVKLDGEKIFAVLPDTAEEEGR